MYREYTGAANVMQALAKMLGEKKGAVNPVSYCPCAVVALRARRYVAASGGWWIDVCTFKPNTIYAVGTFASPAAAAEMRETLRAPSKIVAYIACHRPDLKLPSSIDRSAVVAAISTVNVDPFGGGEFFPQPLTYSDDE